MEWSGDYSYTSDLINSEYLYAKATGGNCHFGHIYLRTKNEIDISDYSTYEIELKTSHMGNDRGSFFGFSNNLLISDFYKVTPSGGSFLGNNNIYSEFTKITGTIDASKKSTPYHFFCGGYIDNGNTSEFYIKSVVLYK